MIEVRLTQEKRRRWIPFRRRRFVLRIPQAWSEVKPLARRERWWCWVATLEPTDLKRKIMRDLVPTRWRILMNDLSWGALVQRLEWVEAKPDAEVIPLQSFFHRYIRYVFRPRKDPMYPA